MSTRCEVGTCETHNCGRSWRRQASVELNNWRRVESYRITVGVEGYLGGAKVTTRKGGKGRERERGRETVKILGIKKMRRALNFRRFGKSDCIIAMCISNCFQSGSTKSGHCRCCLNQVLMEINVYVLCNDCTF